MLVYVLGVLLGLSLMPYAVYCMLYLWTYDCEKRHLRKGSCEPTISLITATYNEEKNILRKLQNTFQIDYPSSKMEILVIDSSVDKTPTIVEDWTRKYQNMRLIREERRKGLASALNTGYSQAKAEIVIKSDCDQLLDRNSIRQLISNFSDSKIGAVSGKQLLVTSNRNEAGYRSLVDLKRCIENKVDSIYLLEPFSAFRRDLVEHIDERSVADEAELALKIRRKGYKVMFDPNAYFYESVPSRRLTRLRIKQRRAQGHIRLILSNLDLLFSRKYDRYGMIVFPLNFYLMIVAPWLFVMMFSCFPILLEGLLGMNGVITCCVLYFLLAALYVFGWPKVLAGYIDSQLSLLAGFLNLAAKGPSYLWTREMND